MQRLAESATVRERTLWEAVLELIEKEQPTRARIVGRFHVDGEKEVASVLGDLVRSGLVFTTGAGESAIYGLTGDAVRGRIQEHNDLESIANVVWVKVFRKEATRREELGAIIPADPSLVARAVDDLVASGRMDEIHGELHATNFVLPLGTDQGWEAALLDHFRAVAIAIATKVRSGVRGSDQKDRIGGSTFTFTLTSKHPFATEVYDLLRTKRLELQSLWDRVTQYNQDHPLDTEDVTRVTFYLGQTLEQHEGENGKDENR
jgi:hypothetical protein